MSVGVCQRAFCCQPGKPVSAPADSQAPSANPSETCAEWNWHRSRRRPGWRLPTRQLIGRWSRPANRPCFVADDGKKGMTNGEKRKKGGGGELLGTKNQSCVTRAIAQCSDPPHRRSHCLHNERLYEACKTVRFSDLSLFSTREAAPVASSFCC